MKRVVLSVIGRDRPGLTEQLAKAVLAAEGNWLESRLSRLGGYYFGAVLVALEPSGIDALHDAVRALEADGLEARIVDSEDNDAGAGEAVALRLVGQDRPGIVRQVSAVLSALRVNIETLESQVLAEPHSGAPLFELQAALRLPPSLALDQVQTALEAISAEVMVDIALSPAPPA